MAYAVPGNIPSRTAAAALIQGLTALTNVTQSYNVQSGDIFLFTPSLVVLGSRSLRWQRLGLPRLSARPLL